MTNNIPLQEDARKAVEKYNVIKDCLKIVPGRWNLPPFIDPICPTCLLDASPSHNFGPLGLKKQDSWIFMISNLRGGTLEWKVTVTKDVLADPDWITLIPTSGTGSGIITVRIDTTGFTDQQFGIHGATVTVISNCGEKTGKISVNISSDEIL